MWMLDESINSSPRKNESIHKLRLLRKYKRKMEELYWDDGINQEFVSKQAPRITSDLSNRFKEQRLLSNADRCKYENPKHSFIKSTRRLVRNFQNCADIERCESSTTYETMLDDDYDDELLLACLKAEKESKSTKNNYFNRDYSTAPRTTKNCNTVPENDCSSVRNFQSCAGIKLCESSTRYETCESNASNSMLNDNDDDELLLACLKAEKESKLLKDQNLNRECLAAQRTTGNAVPENDCVRNFKNSADIKLCESSTRYEKCESNASNLMLNENDDDQLLLACLKAEKELKSIENKDLNRDCADDGDFSFKTFCNKKPNPLENVIDMHSKPIDKYSLHNTSKTDEISSESAPQANLFPSKVSPDSICRLVPVCRRKITYGSNAGYVSKDGVGIIRPIKLSQNMKIEETIVSQPGMKTPLMENDTCWKDDWDFFVNFQTEDAFKLPPTQSKKSFNENFSEVPKTVLRPNYSGKFQMASRKEIKISKEALTKAEAFIQKYGTAQENIDSTEVQKTCSFFVEPNVPTNCFPASTSSNAESLGTELNPTSKNYSFQVDECVGNIEVCTQIEFDQGQNSLLRNERKLMIRKEATNLIEGTALKKVKLAHNSKQFLDRNTFVQEEEFRGFCTASKKYISVSNDAKLRAATIIRESSESSDYDILKPQPTSKSVHPLEHNSNERDLEVCKRYIKEKRSSPKLDLIKLKGDYETDTAKTSDNASTKCYTTFHNRNSSNNLVYNATDCNFVRNISTKICSSSLLSSNACRPSGLRCRTINSKK